MLVSARRLHWSRDVQVVGRVGLLRRPGVLLPPVEQQREPPTLFGRFRDLAEDRRPERDRLGLGRPAPDDGVVVRRLADLERARSSRKSREVDFQAADGALAMFHTCRVLLSY